MNQIFLERVSRIMIGISSPAKQEKPINKKNPNVGNNSLVFRSH